MKIFFLMLLIFFVTIPSLYGEEGSLKKEVKELKTTVEKLQSTVESQSKTIETQEKRIQELEAAQGSVQEELKEVKALPAPPPIQPVMGLQAFNPEIGVLGDIVGSLSENSADTEGNDKLSVRELELIFGHPVDPYSRFDATITFSDFEEPVVEEAYITHWGIPWDIKGRLGRIRPKIGKASAIHRDQLDTVDDPLVVQKYLGSEGLFRTAAELSTFLPLPWESVVHEFTAGIMEGGIGENGTLFGTTRRRPSFYSHLKNFWEISEATNFELGGTHLVGSKDADAGFEVNALGLDATLIHYVTPTNKLKLQSEVYFQNRDETDAGLDDTPWGAYSLVDYRFSPRFGLGGRFDYVEPVDNPTTSPRDADIGVAGYLTFYQSEFARWRAEYQHVEFAVGDNDERVFLQGTIAIGVHKHQLQ